MPFVSGNFVNAFCIQCFLAMPVVSRNCVNAFCIQCFLAMPIDFGNFVNALQFFSVNKNLWGIRE
jgi:hypothetical protein